MPRFSPSPETFFVEEIPAYLPSGTGEHTFVFVEKRSLTTLDAINDLARRLGVPPREIGYAGMKDRHATTRQWLSIPRVTPETALAAGDDRLRILRAERHGNKLRTGHLRGNRFEVVIAERDGEADAATWVTAFAARLARLSARGLPNRYGDQRFGKNADNAARGIAVLRGDQRERDHRRRRLLLSAAQSAVFNEVLTLRADQDLLARVISGDVLQKTQTGGVFITEDPTTDQGRLDAGELVVTGPMPGGWAREPPPDTEARAIEDKALEIVGVTRLEFATVGRDLPGTRRPLLVPVTIGTDAVIADPEAPRTIRVRFELPAGTYATVLLEALGVTIDGGPRQARDVGDARDTGDAGDAG